MTPVFQDTRTINHIVIHCAATREGVPVTAAQIRQWHLNGSPPFSDIGYHYVIELDGRVVKGRNDARTGAGVSGHNHDTIHICYVGGLDRQGGTKDTRTIEQRRAMTALVDALSKLYPEAEILGHRDLSPDKDGDGVVERHEFVKDCPCFDVRAWWAGKDWAER